MRPCGACACAAIALSLTGPARAADPPAKPASTDKTAPAPAPKPDAAPKAAGADKAALPDDAAKPTDKAQPADDTVGKPPRPPLPPEPPRKPLPWAQHLEVGGGLAITALLADGTTEGKPTQVHLKPNAGFHLRLSWEVLRYLWFTGYLVEANHALDLPAGSLGLPGTLSGGSAHTYTFGGRISPTLPIGSRVRLWITAGAGWGQVQYPLLTVKQPGHASFTVAERSASIVEVPLGVGAAFEIVPRWLRLHLELTGSLLPSQIGEALEHAQAIDDAGKMRDVGPMPHLAGSIVQTIGLSLVL